MRTKRIFREWQHPRASNGRFAKKGSPAWVKAAAEKFRNAPEGLKAGTHGPGEATRTNRPQIARGAKAEALFAKHDASVTTRLGRQPVQGPAAPPKKAVSPGARRTVAQDAQKAINAKSVDTPRDTAKTVGMSTTDTPAAAVTGIDRVMRARSDKERAAAFKELTPEQIVQAFERNPAKALRAYVAKNFGKGSGRERQAYIFEQAQAGLDSGRMTPDQAGFHIGEHARLARGTQHHAHQQLAADLLTGKTRKLLDARNGKATAPKTGMEATSARIAEQRGLGGVEIPLDRKTRTGLSDRALAKADRMTAEPKREVLTDAELRSIAGRYAPGSVEAMDAKNELASRRLGIPPSPLPVREDPNAPKNDWTADVADRVRALDERDARRAANPLGADVLDKPSVNTLAVAKAAKANAPTGYDEGDRANLVYLARQAGISVRGKSNHEIAAALKAKDDARKKRLNPKSLGTDATTGGPTGMSRQGVDMSKVTAMGVFSTDPEVRAAAEAQIEHGNRTRAAAEAKAIAEGRLAPRPTAEGAAETRRLGAGRNMGTEHGSGMDILAEAAAQRARDEQARRTAAQGGPAKPRVSPVAAAAAQRATAPKAEDLPEGITPAMVAHQMGLSDKDLKFQAQNARIDTQGMSRREIAIATIEHALGFDKRMKERYSVTANRSRVEDVGNFTTGNRSEIGPEREVINRPKGEAAKVAAPARGRFARASKGDVLSKLDTRRDSSHTGGVNNAPTTEANVPKLENGMTIDVPAGADHVRKSTYRLSDIKILSGPNEFGDVQVRGMKQNLSGGSRAGRATSIVTFVKASDVRPVGDAPTTEAKPHLADFERNGPGASTPEILKAVRDDANAPAHWRTQARAELARRGEASRRAAVAAVGNRPRTGTYTGEIKADRKERLNDKAFTDHVKTLTLTANTGDEAKAWGFDHSDRPLQVGDEVMVDTFDRLRRGIVTHVTRDGKGNARVAYATPTGGYAQETTAPHANVLQLVDPAKRPRENRAALLPKIAPEARGPRRMTDEEKAASKAVRTEVEKAAAAQRRQRFFDEKINGITEALNGGSHADDPAWHLHLTTEEGLVSLAKHLGVKVPNRAKNSMGNPLPRDRDALRKSIVEAVRERLGKAQGRAEAPANEGLAQRAERTAEKASLRAMSDADLRAAYRQASGLDAKRYQAEIDRRNNLVTAPAGDSITRHIVAPVSVDIFENGAGQADIGGTVYDLSRQDGKWVAERMEGPAVGDGHASASTVADLARKLADAHGVSGAVSIEDERGKGRSLTQRFEHTAKAAPEGPRRGSIEARIVAKEREIERRVGAVSLAREARSNTGARIQSGRESKASAALSRARSELAALEREQRDQQAPRASVPTPIPVGATDADRARLRPRREGETDLGYSVRNAPSDFAAENILKGYNLPGLRAVARAEGVTVSAGATKPQIISLLLDAMRRRDRDARAVGQRVEPNRAHPDLVYPGS